MDYLEVLSSVGLVLAVIVAAAAVYFVGTAIKGHFSRQDDADDDQRR